MADYLEKFYKGRNKKSKLALAISALSFLVLLAIISAFPFRNSIYNTLYPKPASEAAPGDKTAFILTASASSVPVNGTTSVSVYVRSDVDDANFFAPKIIYDKSKVSVESITQNPTDFPQWVENFNDVDNQMIRLAAGKPTPGLKTNGSNVLLATVVFKGVAIGQSPLTFSPQSAIYRNSDNQNILVSSQNEELTLSVTKEVLTLSAQPTVSPTSTSATINWTTNLDSTTALDYGLVQMYDDTATTSGQLKKDHQVTVSNLVSCAGYHYLIKSKDIDGDQIADSDRKFGTTGCLGNADIINFASDVFDPIKAYTLSLQPATGKEFKLMLQAGFLGSPTIVQILQFNRDQIIASLGEVSGLKLVNQHVYGINAINSQFQKVQTFDKPVEIRLTYGDDDVAGLQASSIKMYQYAGSAWAELTSCTNDTVNKTISCPTSLSIGPIALFAQAAQGGNPPPPPPPPPPSGGGGNNPPPPPPPSSGGSGGTNRAPDINGSGRVDVFDLSILLRNFGKNTSQGDLDGNGRVDITDLSILLRNWTR